MYFGGNFFSESVIRFFKSPNLQKKKIFQKTILSFKFELPANNSKVLLAGNFNLNFKIKIVFGIFFFEI